MANGHIVKSGLIITAITELSLKNCLNQKSQ